MKQLELFPQATPGRTRSKADQAREDAVSAIDDLIRGALAYHTSGGFVELMQFTRRLPAYSPFNCMLLHIQNPKVSFVARPEQWTSVGRKVRPGARPLVILAPMHPVLFVFDVADTDGEPLSPAIKRKIEDPFGVEGTVKPLTWTRILRKCDNLGINIVLEQLNPTIAGYVARVSDSAPPDYAIRLNETYDLTTRFATLTHELGHLFCGHLGSLANDFWEPRLELEVKAKELEAEAVAYLVTSRMGLHTASKKYLSIYLKPDAVLPEFSMEAILTAAGAVEGMAKGILPAKERARRKKLKEENGRVKASKAASETSKL